MRIIIDTNIWVSGLLWRGLPWRLLRLAESDQVELCTSSAAMNELQEVLAYERLQIRVQKLGLTTADLLLFALRISTLFDDVFGDTIVLADPDDDIFLHLAMAVQAEYVVSGDNHLLDLAEIADIPILTIREFMTREFPEYVE